MPSRETGRSLIFKTLQGLKHRLMPGLRTLKGLSKLIAQFNFQWASRPAVGTKKFSFSTAIYRKLPRFGATYRDGLEGPKQRKWRKEQPADFGAGSPSGGQKIRGADFTSASQTLVIAVESIETAAAVNNVRNFLAAVLLSATEAS
jgi:hypothetical protein